MSGREKQGIAHRKGAIGLWFSRRKRFAPGQKEEATAAGARKSRTGNEFSVMSGEDVAKAFVAHFYSKFANNGAMVSVLFVFFSSRQKNQSTTHVLNHVVGPTNTYLSVYRKFT